MPGKTRSLLQTSFTKLCLFFALDINIRIVVIMAVFIDKEIDMPDFYLLFLRHRETSRDALLEFIVCTENRSACLRL